MQERYVCPKCVVALPYERTETNWHLNRHMLRWRGEHPTLQRMGALCVYRRENGAARLVHELKFGRNRDLGLWMGRLAARRLRETGLFDGVDALVPLPLSRKRLRQRGFNQAEAIACGMAAELDLPVRNDLLVRLVERESQTHYDLAERFRNGRHLFELAREIGVGSCHLMLVDDVLTTGSTMMSAVEALERMPEVCLSAFAWAWVNLSSEVWSRAKEGAEA